MRTLKDQSWGDWERTSHDGKVYRQEDLDRPAFQAAFKEAFELWHKRAKAAYKKRGDTGSCILGDGIAIAVRPPRRRNTYRFVILPPPGGFGMGEGAYAGSADEVVEFLKKRGVDAWYHPGRMD